ncbi:unnamed protein product [Linum trigynum]|uniref:Retroviral polymerase SH3-like domain-containing protein n=1 Tax=Linum trigynum TaxID=586398 RepID=A0AAV2DU83_9ROSI
MFLINRLPFALLNDITPYERLYGKPPDYSFLRVFGCLCYAGTLSQGRKKFDSRARQCLFLGFTPGIKGYKLLDLSSHAVFVSRDVKFYEQILPYKRDPSPQPATSSHIPSHPISFDPFPDTPTPTPPPPSPPPPPSFSPSPQSPFLPLIEDMREGSIHDDYASEGEALALPFDPPKPSLPEPSLRRSDRQSKPPSYLVQNYKTQIPNLKPTNTSPHSLATLASFISDQNHTPEFQAYALSVLSMSEPDSYREAIQHEHWRKAIMEELKALQANGT